MVANPTPTLYAPTYKRKHKRNHLHGTHEAPRPTIAPLSNSMRGDRVEAKAVRTRPRTSPNANDNATKLTGGQAPSNHGLPLPL